LSLTYKTKYKHFIIENCQNNPRSTVLYITDKTKINKTEPSTLEENNHSTSSLLFIIHYFMVHKLTWNDS